MKPNSATTAHSSVGAGLVVIIAAGSALLAGWIAYRVGLRTGRLDSPVGRVGALEPAPVPALGAANIPAPSKDFLESRQGPRVTRRRDTGELDGLHARIAELEAELARRSQAEQPAPTPAPKGSPPTPDEIGSSLRALSPNNREAREALRLAEVELQREFLALYPDHPQAGKHLIDLSNNLIFLPGGDPYQVLVDFEDKVFVPTARLEGLKANALIQSGRREEGVALYERLSHDPRLSENEQCEKAFWHAYSVQGSGKGSEAIALYHALLDRIGDDVPPELKNTVGGVKNQLEKLEASKK